MALTQNQSDALTVDHESVNATQSINGKNQPPNKQPLEGTISITGSEQIDRIIIELDPNIINMPISGIEEIRDIIADYIFGRHISAISIIREKTNQEIAEYIEGIMIIARENRIDNIIALQEYFTGIIGSIDIDHICDK